MNSTTPTNSPATQPPRAPRALLLDLDGTLVDSLPDIAAAANHALAELGRPTVDIERVRSFIGHGADWLMRCGLDGETALLERGVKLFIQHYDQHPADLANLFPGWPALLERCRSADIALAIVSNKPVNLCHAVLTELGVAELFPVVIGDGSYPERKPSPRPFLGALEALGCAAHEALVVGDGLPDIEGAQAGKLAVAAVTWGYTPREQLAAMTPDWILDDVDALGQLVFENPAPAPLRG